MKVARPEFTPEQEHAVGELVCDRWGDEMQAGVDEQGRAYIVFRTSPHGNYHTYYVEKEGTVLIKRWTWGGDDG